RYSCTRGRRTRRAKSGRRTARSQTLSGYSFFLVLPFTVVNSAHGLIQRRNRVCEVFLRQLGSQRPERGANAVNRHGRVVRERGGRHVCVFLVPAHPVERI